MEEIKIPNDWEEYFLDLNINDIYQKIKNKSELNDIYPDKNQILNAFNLCKLNNLKVIIIGQDPYHNPGQANGLSFSVNKNIRIPPSLKNIFKELNNDLNINIPEHGDLTNWAKQGILLLNNVLTVYKNEPNNKIHKIWNNITDNLIKNISIKNKNLVFILWGNNAQKKIKYIENIKINNHLILKGGHPSPLNRNIKNNFFGQKFFSKTNQFLIDNEKEIIDWNL